MIPDAVGRRAGLVPLALLLAALSWGLPDRAAGQELACGRCHGELEFLRQHVDSLETARRLRVTRAEMEGSGHDAMSCGECHRGFGTFPHDEDRASTVACGACHEEPLAAWEGSCHGAELCEGEARCADCHGVHAVETAEALADSAGILAMNRRCADCHGTMALPGDTPHAGDVACHACHAPHDVQPVDHPAAAVAPGRQPRTCGVCHDSVAGLWVEDVHGRAVTGGDEGRGDEAGESAAEGEGESASPPSCTTCHGAHPTVDLDAPGRPAAEVARCETCHEDYADTFGDSYHGQAATLGSPAAASCADCHTAHRILPASDPASSVSDERLVETCGSCHPQANASFVEFEAHADPHDREKNPVLYWTYLGMTALLVGVLSVFGLHTLLWLVRLGVGRLRGEGANGGGPASAQREGES